MKRQGGFTLIELVVVIVILGILAVTAAPRFLNLQSDARESALQGLKGAMQGASGIVFGKAAIEGVEASNSEETLQDGIVILNGYPRATSAGIVASVSGLNEDWAWATNNNTLVATFAAGALTTGVNTTASDITDTGCYVQYSEAASGAEPTIAVEDITGC
ncbi:type II secretion system protein [Vibrio campbellii]|uniref:type II secretion system protein n=1 Tax=Vibrio campbellii TaxID=680 RepID=UPI000685C8B3|nr:type II secretion system protein [Vibrio campbellii]